MFEQILGSVAPRLVDGILSLFGVESESDKATKLEAQKLVNTIMLEEIQARNLQLKVNEAEAGNPNRAWPSWRESVGYICALAFGWAFVLQPVLVFLLTAAGKPIDLPNLNLGEIMPVLLGMLGLSVSRSFEKINSPDIAEKYMRGR